MLSIPRTTFSMNSIPSAILQRIRVFGFRFFHLFGIHCATHQIRVLLISAVVITSLLFPAIAIYSPSKAQFLAGLTLFDSFLPLDDSTFAVKHDLRQLWEGHDALRVREDSLALARCGMDGIIRAERLLVHSLPQEDVHSSTLTKKTLLSTLELERRITHILTSRGIPCIRTSEGPCFSISPSAFWNHDENILSADPDILHTLSLSRNTSISGVSVCSDMVLAGRELNNAAATVLDSAMFLVLTYFFPDKDCTGNVGHFTWWNVLQEAAGQSDELVMQTQAPRLVALEYDKNMTTKSRISVLSVFSYIAYFLFFVYFSRSMRQMNMVHSPIGLAFTGITEIVISTITSLSVCALVNFRVTMVPWEIFPIVVIFIGVENMFSLVDAVVKTPVTLSVKERIAEGLGRAGTSNSLKLVSYNTVLGVIAFFSTGAIRQFCAFAIVVLVAHWFLVHTFFITVLSIDIQRLELDELLRQNPTLGPDVSLKAPASPNKPPQTIMDRMALIMKNLHRGRAAKNISLLLLLAITATLYYATYPYSARDTKAPLTPAALSRATKMAHVERVSPAFQIWQILNPSRDGLVHVRVETPSILVLGPDGTGAEGSQEQEKSNRLRWLRVIRPVVWLLKILIVPIVVTTTALYGLLLYLLKDAELLEAQRHGVEAEAPAVDEPPAVEPQISFATLPRAFNTDIDLIAASANGEIVATIGLQNEFVVWRMEQRQTPTRIDTTDAILGGTSTPSAAGALTAVAVNECGTFCAVGTGAGVIAIWQINKNYVKPMPHLRLDNTSAVAHLYFATSPTTPVSTQPFLLPTAATSRSGRSSPTDPLGCLYASYDNGTIVKWSIGSLLVPTYIIPSRSASVMKAILLPVQADKRLLAGFCLEDGTLELRNLGDSDPLIKPGCCIAAGNSADLVSKVHVCSLELSGSQRLVIGAATNAGVVSLWDGETGECIHILDEIHGTINNLRVSPVDMKTCQACGELPMEYFSLSFSMGQVVLFYRAYISLPTRRCSCPRNLPQPPARSPLVGRNSRSGSASGATTPAHSRSRVSSFSSATSAFDTFPVSAHGVHSRRASDKETTRRQLEFLSAECEDADAQFTFGPQNVIPVSSRSLAEADGSIWYNLFLVRAADTTFERGCWDIADNKIVGIRRKKRQPPVRGKGAYRMQVKTESVHGLTSATMERWELWTFDPFDARFQASPLGALKQEGTKTLREAESPRQSARPQMSRRKGSADAVPRLHFTRVSPFLGNASFCLAGFGNTVGLFNLHAGSSKLPQRASLERSRLARD